MNMHLYFREIINGIPLEFRLDSLMVQCRTALLYVSGSKSIEQLFDLSGKLSRDLHLSLLYLDQPIMAHKHEIAYRL